ncbi:MAG: DUF285 domain-containing protein [Muribaculaceae bacterium]|nr:DUF285 domain-containing protein [Muribaculaceae bacterium]
MIVEESFQTIRPLSCCSWFFEFKELTEIEGLEYLNTQNVTDMRFMFFGCFTMTALNLSKFNTENVTDMSAMFQGCSSLRLLDLSQAKIFDFAGILSNIAENALIFVPEGTTALEGRANVVVSDNCENLAVNYGANYQLLLKIPHEFTAEKVTINRSFTKDQPYTLYLPFAMIAADYGTFYTGGQYNEADRMVYSPGLPMIIPQPTPPICSSRTRTTPTASRSKAPCLWLSPRRTPRPTASTV